MKAHLINWSKLWPIYCLKNRHILNAGTKNLESGSTDFWCPREGRGLARWKYDWRWWRTVPLRSWRWAPTIKINTLGYRWNKFWGVVQSFRIALTELKTMSGALMICTGLKSYQCNPRSPWQVVYKNRSRRRANDSEEDSRRTIL